MCYLLLFLYKCNFIYIYILPDTLNFFYRCIFTCISWYFGKCRCYYFFCFDPSVWLDGCRSYMFIIYSSINYLKVSIHFICDRSRYLVYFLYLVVVFFWVCGFMSVWLSIGLCITNTLYMQFSIIYLLYAKSSKRKSQASIQNFSNTPSSTKNGNKSYKPGMYRSTRYSEWWIEMENSFFLHHHIF